MREKVKEALEKRTNLNTITILFDGAKKAEAVKKKESAVTDSVYSV